MRVITGSAKGLRLKIPVGNHARPPLDMLKGALFNILAGFVEGRRVLDLYAGSGSLGIESLSRGAAAATFVDESRRCVEVIEENLERARLSDRATVRAGDARAVLADLAKNGERFGLVFLDPPFEAGTNWIEKGWPVEFETAAPAVLETDGILVFRAESSAPPRDALGPLHLLKTRGHGRSVLGFYSREL